MATHKDLFTIKTEMKTFALYAEYKELYDKVVPPVAEMEKIGHKMEADVE